MTRSAQARRRREGRDPFEDLCIRDACDATTDDERNLLRHPEVLEQFYDMLRTVVARIESQLAADAINPMGDPSWRGRAVALNKKCQARIAEIAPAVKRARRVTREAVS